ncbi:unnamed protein product, partial [Rotaria socialis]
NTQIILLVCQIINGYDTSHETLKSFQYSKILLKCLEYEPNMYRLIYFTANYLSSQYRIDILNIICQTYTDNIEQGIECIMELINRMKKYKTKNSFQISQ